MEEQLQTGSEQSLRVLLPNLYKVMTEELENQFNIHPYDIQITAIEEESGYRLNFLYGDNYKHKESQFFQKESVDKLDNQITDFIEKFGESCKQAMIADYFKMLKM